MISFGLVSVPVRLFPAVAEHKLHFHLVHTSDGGPIGYQKICKLEDRPVPDDEVVKAFEYRKGEYVQMGDKDFELARAETTRAIEISDFVPYADIDPIFFAKAYYAGPGAGGERVYALLARAMEKSGLAAIVKFVMRETQHLGALRVSTGMLVLEQLHFADELRPAGELAPEKQRLSKQELEMAGKLIDSYKGAWRPEKYKDTYHDELCALIAAKRRGTARSAAPRARDHEPGDLMEALRQSIEAAREVAPRKPAAQRRRAGPGGRARKPSGG
jgi:DNA end-binding protein Ku